jgi:uncharacterized protein (TIGR02391 family)
MSSLSSADKKYLDNALRLDSGGWIIRFTTEEFRNFFAEVDIEIEDAKYAIYGATQADKLRAFFEVENNQVVGRTILEFAALFRNRELAMPMNVKFSVELEKIGQKLLSMPQKGTLWAQSTSATIDNNLISIVIRPEIYEHIKRYLDTEDYFHAVEESYKVVRDKLRTITGQEQAHKAFSEENYAVIFGHAPQTDIEKDFFEGTKFLHMALQKFRNEKAHSLAGNLDRNLAIHYLSLASLAYDLISRGQS